jgi:alkylhydroperoxidase family enzyme
MTWLRGFDDRNVGVDDLLALRPAATARLRELETALWYSALDGPTVALVRDRVSMLLGLSSTPWDATAPRSARDKAALGFAEQFVLDPQGITDEQAAAMHSVFTEPELTALTFCVAVYDAIGRITLVLGAQASELAS